MVVGPRRREKHRRAFGELTPARVIWKTWPRKPFILASAEARSFLTSPRSVSSPAVADGRVIFVLQARMRAHSVLPRCPWGYF